METATTRRAIAPKETFAEALHRLARQAAENGVKVYSYDLGRGIEFYATSTSRPGTLHRVTLFSCDCAGFIGHGRCQHLAALLAEVDELPPLDPIADSERQRRAGEIKTLRAEVERLRRVAKSSGELMSLQNARIRLQALVDEDRAIARALAPANAPAIAA